ncbi:hypothetical protein [Saccharopolyspora shandongensis]|uniref:hypothetical protein n=1 Tax=Saccharopolyspora shandongensis TaxID=418495 RepID=UPI0033D1AB65
MSDELAEFPFEDSALLDALVTADLTTGPAGQRLTYDERIEEIFSRYAPEGVARPTSLPKAPISSDKIDISVRGRFSLRASRMRWCRG